MASYQHKRVLGHFTQPLVSNLVMPQVTPGKVDNKLMVCPSTIRFLKQLVIMVLTYLFYLFQPLLPWNCGEASLPKIS